MNTALVSSTYFGPIQWYRKLARYDRVLVEHCDHYQKQTYRNRCTIATTQGVQTLTVPVERDGGAEVRISDHGNWRHLHWHALLSAYSESPFFDYYADDIRPFFERRWAWLYDFNLEIAHTLCGLLDLHPDLHPTDSYLREGDFDDFREVIHPKRPLPDADGEVEPYYQVFACKQGFHPNLSVLDLLFNMGPESIFTLMATRNGNQKWQPEMTTRNDNQK